MILRSSVTIILLGVVVTLFQLMGAQSFSLPYSESSRDTEKIKKIIITGGNKGIGRAVCELMLKEHRHVHVVLACRSLERGSEAIDGIKKELGESCCNGRLDLIQIDTTSDESVKNAASNFDDSSLYGIINNAGIGWRSNASGEDIVNTNYFGPRRVNDYFAQKLMRPGGRIVNIGSAAGPLFVQGKTAVYGCLGEPWKIQRLEELDELAKASSVQYTGRDAYGFSKALLNAYTWWHGKNEPDLIINSITPGSIATDLSPKGNPPSQGAKPVVWLMTKQMEYFDQNLTGLYYGSDCKRSPLHMYRSPGDPEYQGLEGFAKG